MKQDKMTASLAIVKEKQGKPGENPGVILPRELLRHNYNELEQHYFIHDIQKLASNFPEHENIYILGHEVTDDFPLHNHDFFEMSYVCRGEILNVIDGVELYMSQGEITLINRNALQSLKCINPEALIVNVCIKEELFDRTLKEFIKDENPVSQFLRYENPGKEKYMFFSAGYSREIPVYMNNMVEEYTRAKFHQTFSLEAWLLLLFDSLAKSGRYSYSGIDKNALEIIQYIQEHCIQNTLEEMAAQLGYNANYLTGYIKKHTGKNCREIMKEARLKESLRLLADTPLSVYEVSELCGYSSPSHFFRIFKEAYQMSPREYRSQMQNVLASSEKNV